MDNELSELCKEVYEKTGWDKSTEIIRKYSLNKVPSVFTRPPKGMELGVLSGTIEWQAPLYTSDYLLQKLPKKTWIKHSELWVANLGRLHLTSDTPLKALLKLTLALHQAGELK